MDSETTSCAECGMSVHAGEYHPYGACLMYKGCGNAATVRENLTYIKESGIDEINKELDELKESKLEALRARGWL